MKPNWTVRPIKSSIGRDFIREHHYSHSCHNGPLCWGLFEDDELIGVCAFATPGSESVRRSVFGAGHESEVTELHRLVILDGTPTNSESWFIVRALAGLALMRPGIRAVLSFADESEGHLGIIYQATNAIYTGKTARPRKFYRDGEGRLRHPRQNGHNITAAEAAERGWTSETRGQKHRYVYLIGGPAQRRMDRRRVLFDESPYPKAVAA